MCLTCGCNLPADDHGNYANITIQKLYDAANAADIEVGDAVNNLENTFANKVANQPFNDIDDFRDDDDNDDNNAN